MDEVNVCDKSVTVTEAAHFSMTWAEATIISAL